MAKTFIDFIWDCEQSGGEVLLREYLASNSIDKMMEFFGGKNSRGFVYTLQPGEKERLWEAKARAKYFSIDYEYLNSPGKSY